VTERPAAYRGLILDFGGVITTDFYAALEGFCLRQGLPADAVRHVLRDTDEGRHALAGVETGRLPQSKFEWTLAQLLNVDGQGLLGRALADLRPSRPVLELVDAARGQGVAVAVLSNSWGAGSYDPYVGYDLEERFDAVVISDRVGLGKPDPAIYQLTADQLGLPAEQCVFVDDTAHNLPPARQLGMATVLFSNVAVGISQIKDLLALR
jgi:epoxide hydrolase-like predicted phosphatase